MQIALLILPRTKRFANFSSPQIPIFAHILPYIIFIGGTMCANLTLGLGNGGHWGVLSQISIKSIAINVGYYFCVFSDFFALPNPFFTLYSDLRYAYAIPNPLNFALFVLSIPLIYRGVRIAFGKNPIATAFIALFMLGFMALLILFPARQGIRYAFGVIPFLVFFGILGLSFGLSKAKNITRFATIALIIFFGIKDISLITKNIANDFKAPNIAGEAFSDEARDIYKFIANHTPKDAKIIFFKPRVLYLNANRLSFHATKLGDFKKADFVLGLRWDWIEVARIQGFIDELKAQGALNAVYENKYFVLYKISDSAP